MAGLMVPAVHSTRGAAQRTQSMNNLKQIAPGDAQLRRRQQEPSRRPIKADKDGKPLLSWRVLILPYVEQEDLYKQFHLDEPWDSEHNKKLIEKMPAVYRVARHTQPRLG